MSKKVKLTFTLANTIRGILSPLAQPYAGQNRPKIARAYEELTDAMRVAGCFDQKKEVNE